MNVYFPIIGKINDEKKTLFKKNYDSLIIYPEDKLISYIDSKGGVSNIASYLAERISELPMPTIAYGGWVSSAAALIFSSFKERFAFEDSKFLIHSCIPPKGMENDKIFKEYDLQVWNFMSKRMKISAKELEIIAKKDKRISVKEALEVGLVHEIIKGSYKNYSEVLTKRGLML